jgi:MoaA/NifB/PqqE/SkfB family radical SAM enzyme
MADALGAHFPSLCTSVLGSTARRHDALVGRDGAFDLMRAGIGRVLDREMRVEINVCTSTVNYEDFTPSPR